MLISQQENPALYYAIFRDEKPSGSDERDDDITETEAQR
jgi:hypothetical protein